MLLVGSDWTPDRSRLLRQAASEEDHWILCRIAERCKLPERAVCHYEKIGFDAAPNSTYALARIRLLELKRIDAKE